MTRPDRPDASDPAREASELAEAWSAIRVHIERLRTLDLGACAPAVVFRPSVTGPPDEAER